ncbi:cyclic nucleotide-binding domain protein (macronuclear) [Tetrahymena thermophila SB210]|uniref:Cyclic nucleotide-binding domain protein n=1 Tax=Tetrahymena thermophila (strain SB210) TaxID=312017 RepID=I7MJM8_TETTS|nr:cyclic nucleotide-binding domain protein [Tetrahymena thermophila SB210]EAS07008.4 cyclic nucleotide-binding domain protein [Tetrahymena thermophila SB210]|eukprot:XP_001027250.4 cyclic nucleotide-binding domain protein [Tetrahymena thermophila SB210]
MFSKPQKVKKILPDLQKTINFFNIPHNLRKRSQMEQLLQVIKQVPFFQKYIENGWESVCQECLEEMTYELIEADQEIFAQGTIGETFYVILEGQVGVYVNIVGNLEENKIVRNDSQPVLEVEQKENNENQEGGEQQQNQEPPKLQKLVKVLESGDSFGELSLIYNRPRLATIRTLEKTHLAVLKKKEFRTILREKEEAQLVKEMQYFTTLPFFEGQNFNLVRDIYLNTFKLKCINKEIIFNEGDVSDSVFIIKSGEFVLFKQFCHEESDQHKLNKDIIAPEMNLYYRNANKQDKKFKKMTLTVLGQNELFGEENLLMSENRTFGVQCKTVTGELLMIKKDQFLNKVMSDTNTRKYIQERCQKKLQNLQNRIQNIEGQLHAYSSYLVGDDRKIKLRRNMESMTNLDNYYIQKSRENSLDVDEPSQTQFISQKKEQNTSNNGIKKQLMKSNTRVFSQANLPDVSLTQIPQFQISHKSSEANLALTQQNLNSSLKQIDNHFLNQQNQIDENVVFESCVQLMKQDSNCSPLKHEKLNILKKIAQDIETKNLNQKNMAYYNNSQTQQSSSQPQSMLPSSRSMQNIDYHYDPQIDPLREQLHAKMNILHQQQKQMKIFKLEETVYNGQISHEELSEKLKIQRLPQKKYIDYLKESNQNVVESQSSHIKNVMQKIQKRKEEEQQDQFKLENTQIQVLNKIHSAQQLPNGQTNQQKEVIKQMIQQAEKIWPSFSSTNLSSNQISRLDSAQLDSPLKLEGNQLSSINKKKSSMRPLSSHVTLQNSIQSSPVKQTSEKKKIIGSMNNIQFNLDQVETKQPIINIRPLTGRVNFAKSLTHFKDSDNESFENYSDPTSPSCIGSQRGQININNLDNEQNKQSKQPEEYISPLKQQRVQSAKSQYSQAQSKHSTNTIQKHPSQNQFFGFDLFSKRPSDFEIANTFVPLVPLCTQQKMFSLQQAFNQQLTQHRPVSQQLLAPEHLAFKPKMQMRSKTAKKPQQVNSNSSSKTELNLKHDKSSNNNNAPQKNQNIPLFRPFSSKERSTLQGVSQFFKNGKSGYNLKLKLKKNEINQALNNNKQQLDKILPYNKQNLEGTKVKNEILYINSNLVNKQFLK